MPNSMNILRVLEGQKFVPVVTFNEGDDLKGFAQYLLSIGIACIEVTLRTDYALTAIEKLKNQFGQDMAIGAGTVITSKQVEALKEIEIDFIVSPGLSNQVHAKAMEAEIPFLPGVATPSEIIQAAELEINVLKFFPAHINGGLPALKTYAQVFPEVKFCPTGGINQETSQDYLALDNVFAVGGSWFQKEFNQNISHR
jgi:2-dehydro-3-deoxyphosphogluconate aldolase / (4S)-4-hydroxy-2-oxoglutarate aldolase